jgi:hypothetical protein
VLSFPASLAERRSRLSDRLGGNPTPTEATHAVHELLDELLTLDLSRRSTQERQVDERALRIVRESAGFLQAIRATARWSEPTQTADRRPGRPWRILGLLVVQLVLSLGLGALLFGAIQRGAAGGDAAIAFGLVLAAGLIVLQAFTGYRLLGRSRTARPATDSRPEGSGPEIVLSVDDHAVLATLTQALLAVDQLEQSIAASSEAASPKQPGLADYPELLRAIQQVYAARRSEDPQRAQQRAEGLRTSLEQYGVELHDEWTASEPPPPELFTTQRSLDPASRAYRVILPAITDATGVILQGRIAVPGAVPGKSDVAAMAHPLHPDDLEEWRR